MDLASVLAQAASRIHVPYYLMAGEETWFGISHSGAESQSPDLAAMKKAARKARRLYWCYLPAIWLEGKLFGRRYIAAHRFVKLD